MSGKPVDLGSLQENAWPVERSRLMEIPNEKWGKHDPCRQGFIRVIIQCRQGHVKTPVAPLQHARPAFVIPMRMISPCG